ncbi:MAG TPA: hypothetical protein VE487_00380 [Ilumatobacter sp.]|jgi:hypothetical protein|nr:hypothetical protein [Ilumatobacter sp.]
MRKLIAAATLTAGLTLMPAVDQVHAQDDAAAAAEDDDNGDVGLWGLAGLLGLIGLAGLKRRDTRYDHRDTTVGSSAIR